MTSLLRRSALGLLGSAATGLAYASLVERQAYVVRRVSVPVLPPGTRPLRILHLTDLHLVPRQRRKIDWVRGLATLEPDFVVDTGDNLADLRAVPSAVEALAPLMELPGAFVLGSNDYFGPTAKNPLRYFDLSHRKAPETRARGLPTDDLVRSFTSAGWLDLDNARTTTTVAGVRLELVGVNDPHIQLDDYPSVSGPADGQVALTLGVVHAPYQRVLDPMVRDGAGLVLAGHTHGGQLCLPFAGALVTNCDLPLGRAKGVSRWWPGAGSAASPHSPDDAAWLHVSAGLGTSPYAPARFACRPEATLLTLTSRSA
ncbi:metallophosphoesterase [Segeticoccus rhizosphaerae]|jgi:predicted MPP superfamily phosphohydrolase|uniref:metallophosphoesterase n=1 Tax=Segeticoccus rhizosphaerae TaxID=1104777 RepID=UPI001EE4AD89|nr:metallophosphoesterase [Ornithinicoccus soli]